MDDNTKEEDTIAMLKKMIENYETLIQAGKVLFKDGRDLTPEESRALQSYYKRRYKKIKDKSSGDK